LQLTHVDLYLIHWPHAFQPGDANMPKDEHGRMLYDYTPYTDTWRAMEECVNRGLARHIGLSNFNAQQIDDILRMATVRPAVLQVESHPFLVQQRLLSHVRSLNMVMTAYSPLGSPDRPWAADGAHMRACTWLCSLSREPAGEPVVLADKVVQSIADAHHKSPAQVCIRFQVQRGVAVIPKSVNPERIRHNFQVLMSTSCTSDSNGAHQSARCTTLCSPRLT
jgi:alcohol dehydrogenase (NADP+)